MALSSSASQRKHNFFGLQDITYQEKPSGGGSLKLEFTTAAKAKAFSARCLSSKLLSIAPGKRPFTWAISAPTIEVFSDSKGSLVPLEMEGSKFRFFEAQYADLPKGKRNPKPTDLVCLLKIISNFP